MNAEPALTVDPNAASVPRDTAPPTPLESSIAPPNPDRAEPPHPFDEPKEGDDPVRFERGRHPARKDRARPADVPQIQQWAGLVKSLKSTSEADAPRVQALKKQFRELLEIPDAPVVPKEPTKPESAASAPPAPTPPGAFTEREPTIEDFIGKTDDPYAAHVRALSAWDRKREIHEWQTQAAQQHQQQQHQQIQQAIAQAFQAHNTRLAAAKAKYADWDATMAGKQSSVVLDHALAFMPNGDEATYFLGKHPDFLDELNLSAVALPLTDVSVALLQRRLNARMTAGTTGAAPTRPTIQVAPPPPTPVRTGPMPTGATPTADDDDLDAHARRFGVGSRRRR